MAVDKLQENITRFKDPMGKLNAFMVGSSQAGSFVNGHTLVIDGGTVA